MRKVRKSVIVGVSILLINSILSLCVQKNIDNKEYTYEKNDLYTLQYIKEVFETAEISEELRQYISENVMQRGYCELFVGYVQNLSNMNMEKWYNISDNSLRSELLKCKDLQSQSAVKGWGNGVFVYYYEDGIVTVSVENRIGRNVIFAKYLMQNLYV